MGEPHLNRIKLSQFRALVAIADCGNFSEAALSLELSQSAVSHAIATLETELGVILLSRGRYGAHLTLTGERVTAQARQVLQLLEQMAQEANQAKGLQGGRVRVAAFRSVATHVLPEVVAQFRRQFPAIDVLITEHYGHLDVDQALRESRADIGFTYLPASEDLEAWELFRDEYVAILPPAPEPVDARPGVAWIQWDELSQHPLILAPEGGGCSSSMHILQHLLRLGHVPNIAHRVREDSTIVGMVTQGLGATIMPRLAAQPIPPDVRVYSLPVRLERVIGAATLAEALLSPAVFAFLDILKQVGGRT